MTADAGIEIRDYQPSDLPAVTRMWQEVGWIDDSEGQADGLERFLAGARARVGLVDGEAECMVHRTPGTIRYDRIDLPLCAITGVTTSPVARNLGLATRLTAEALAAGAREGAAVAALGMFEQGFYNRFGFGTMGYEHFVTVDPLRLKVAPPTRRQVRLTIDDAGEIADLMARRSRGHGGVALDPPEAVWAEFAWADHPVISLGFRAPDGRLTACFMASNKDEHGPLKVHLMGWEGPDDLRDLLGLFRSLADQVQRLELVEPHGIQLQDVIDKPVRGSEPHDPTHQGLVQAMAWYQARILDLPACIAARVWPGPEVAFNLVLTDPLSERGLDWPGLAGQHTVRIGAPSKVTSGHEDELPVLEASVGAFSRLWFGVRPASGLALTDDLSADPDLLARLDEALRLPPTSPGLSF